MRNDVDPVIESGRYRLTARVAGPAIAVGAVSLGLVLIGACGLGHHDVYVAPPPINSDLQAAVGTRAATTTTDDVVIPPSPSWRIAVNTPPRRSATTPPASTNPADPYATLTPYEEPNAAPTNTPQSTTDPFDNGTTTTTLPNHPAGHPARLVPSPTAVGKGR